MRRARWVRAWAGAATLALAAVLLTACSQPPEPLVGMFLLDGRPSAVFVACNSSLAVLNVYENDPARRPPPDASDSPDASATAATRPIWTVRSESPQLITEVTLFEPPPGWQATESTLTSLEPGVHYSAGGTSLRHARRVDFTTSDLDRLGPDEVLGADRRQRTVTMSRSEFESAATGVCPH